MSENVKCKWQARFFHPDARMPCETIDVGNNEKSAERQTYRLALARQRAGLVCHLVNQRPTEREKHGFLRWRLDLRVSPAEFHAVRFDRPDAFIPTR